MVTGRVVRWRGSGFTFPFGDPCSLVLPGPGDLVKNEDMDICLAMASVKMSIFAPKQRSTTPHPPQPPHSPPSRLPATRDRGVPHPNDSTELFDKLHRKL
ncbi:hypothetical protein E2C01_016752 [Portunus trituberculatus]|uniref:Uncharacterized protein n=1 Tax=Portunus trituberculatus TaxID=210409 RepID=A0A5B7DPW6_PORTR|nr:hypothetical protein [Portunus trituberculatus]